MNLPTLKNSKKKEKHYTNEGVLESLGSIATGMVNTSIDEVGKASINDAWDMLLGSDSGQDSHDSHGDTHSPNHGDLSAGHELDLSNLNEKAHELTEMGHGFAREIIHAGERAKAEDSQEIQVKVQEILIEIKKLSKSSAELQDKVEVISIEQTAGEPGVYHINFLEKMLSFIHELRMNVDDSLAWFGALRSKKAARQYGSMAKKHGTSFTLSNERQVATQVG